jgi:four helix bundle protein
VKTELEARTKTFAVAIVKLVRTFPRSVDGIELGRQLLRAATSVGANYREANRAESRDDFIHKIGVAEKEASETAYWLEVCQGASLGSPQEVDTLFAESGERRRGDKGIIKTTMPQIGSQQDTRIVNQARCCLAQKVSRFPAFPLSALIFP